MFERFTEDARRVIFYGRYEASQYGSPYIETQHLLLGALRECRAFPVLVPGIHSGKSIRAEIDTRMQPGQKISTSVDLPLSNESKRVLAYAAEEAERASDRSIRSEHLVLGLVREEKSLASELLRRRGADLAAMRLSLSKSAMKAPDDDAMYCTSCRQWREPLVCKHCSVAICLICGEPLTKQKPQ